MKSNIRIAIEYLLVDDMVNRAFIIKKRDILNWRAAWKICLLRTEPKTVLSVAIIQASIVMPKLKI